MKSTQKNQPVHYGSYLKLDQLLSAQEPISAAKGSLVHDEHLFITVHQSYELWFKQIIIEIKSVIAAFSKTPVAETEVARASKRLQRVQKIFSLLIDHLPVLETMTPMDFLDFRDQLFPASGFQSVQFRILENILGLKEKNRTQDANKGYLKALTAEDQKIVRDAEDGPTLFDAIEKWLERTPFLDNSDFDFIAKYREAVEVMLSEEKRRIETDSTLDKNDKTNRLKSHESTCRQFDLFFDPKAYQKLIENDVKRISFQASLAALLILSYRDQPILNAPFNLLTALLDIDELMTAWRYRHALMAHRMLGAKIGTGGNFVSDYLYRTIQSHRIFTDFADLSTLLIPRRALPHLPETLVKRLDFQFSYDKVQRAQP